MKSSLIYKYKRPPSYRFPVIMAAATTNYESIAEYTPSVLSQIHASGIFSDIGRKVLSGLLVLLGQFLDAIYDAIKSLLTFNFLSDIPGLKTYTDMIPAVAWALFGMCLIIGGIVLTVASDKIKITDYTRSVLVSAMLIIALPTLISSFDDLKSKGVSDMDSMITNNGGNVSIGQKIIASQMIDIEATAAEKTLVYVYNNDELLKDPYLISGAETLDTDEFGYKVSFFQSYSPGEVKRMAENAFLGMTEEEFDTRFGSDDSGLSLGKGRLGFRLPLPRAIPKETSYATLLEEVELKATGIDERTVEGILGNYYLEQIAKAAIGPETTIDDEGNVIVVEDDTEEISLEDIAKNKLEQYRKLYQTYLDDLESRYIDKGQYNLTALKTGELPVLGVIDFLKEEVYAFNTNYLTAYILIIITIVALILAGFRIANLMFNLVFNQILAPLVFASDLNNSGRSKKFIQNMLSTYIVFIVILFLMVLFLDITAWAMSDTVSIAGNPLGSVLLKIFIVGGCAKGLIDGPDLIVSVLGIDAGVKSGLGVIAGVAAATHAAKGASNLVKGATNAATAPAGVLSNIIDNKGGGNTGEATPSRSQSKSTQSMGNATAGSGTTASSGSSSSVKTAAADNSIYDSSNIFSGRDMTPPSIQAQHGNTSARSAVQGREGSSSHGNFTANSPVSRVEGATHSTRSSSSGENTGNYSTVGAAPQYHSPVADSSTNISSSGSHIGNSGAQSHISNAETRSRNTSAMPVAADSPKRVQPKEHTPRR